MIPTFAGVTNRARQTADEAAVRNMNAALSQNITLDNADIFDTATALSDAGFAAEEGLFPTAKNHAYYWHKPSNTIVYVNTKDGA